VSGGVLLEAALLDEVLVAAGQPAEEEEHRAWFALQSGRRQEDAKGHVAIQSAGPVAIHALLALETLGAGYLFERHVLRDTNYERLANKTEIFNKTIKFTCFCF